jgi:hypothetical protein
VEALDDAINQAHKSTIISSTGTVNHFPNRLVDSINKTVDAHWNSIYTPFVIFDVHCTTRHLQDLLQSISERILIITSPNIKRKHQYKQYISNNYKFHQDMFKKANCKTPTLHCAKYTLIFDTLISSWDDEEGEEEWYTLSNINGFCKQVFGESYSSMLRL